MSYKLQYLTNLSSKNRNFILFLSKFSELNTINLPFDLPDYSKNKEFINSIKSLKYLELNIFLSKNDTIINLQIYIIDSKSANYMELGASIYSKFDIINNNNLTFIFSKSSNFLNKSTCADIIHGFLSKSYRFDKYLSNKNDKYQKTLNLYNTKPFKELIYSLNLLESVNFTKELVSEPANILNPVTYANKCNELKKLGLKIRILNKQQLEKIGMRALLGVSQGSSNDPRVVIFEWNIKPNTKPTVLVGKGVTFDTGGISLKPSSGMEEMIFDMGGSAVVVGSMINAALNNSKKSLVGIIGLVENMPDGKAQRPGDIVKSLSGQTIEILNTDAEGRLVLADILTYIQSKYEAKEIIDFATLTGAIMIALGTHSAGIFTNNNSLSKKLEIAGNLSGEKVWRLPMGNEYNEEINSPRADMKNMGSSKFGGSIHAAQFIHRFVQNNVPWAHIDIAGVSWIKNSNANSFSKLHTPGATAFGVRLIDQFLKGN